MEELHRLAGEEGLTFYQRGKSVGVIEQDATGNDKKHRLSTLGVDLHYKATRERLERGYDPKSTEQSSSEPDMAERKVRRLDPFERRPTFPESVIKELVTNERPEILLDPWEREPNTPAQNDVKQAPSEQDIDDAIPGVFVPPGTRLMSEAEKRIKALEASKTRARERDKEDKDRGDRDR